MNFTFQPTALRLHENEYSNYILPEKECLKRLSKINIFIGPNNSGKSQFLRALFADTSIEIKWGDERSEIQWESVIEGWLLEIETIFNQFNLKDPNNYNFRLKHFIDTLDRGIPYKGIETFFRQLKSYFSELKDFKISSFQQLELDNRPVPISQLRDALFSYASSALTFLEQQFPENYDYKINKAFIPMLRGLLPLTNDKVDIYKLRTVTDYFKGVPQDERWNASIYTGLDIYENVKRKVLGRKADRKEVRDFENFISTTFFDGHDVTLIPDIDSDTLLLGLGQNEQPIYKHGDGMQAIISLLYPVFLNKSQKTLFFIEEPELSMHPGMQRVFLEAISGFRNAQFFITTHSNHFLDMSLDLENISIFSFNNTGQGMTDFHCTITNASHSDINLLDLLGVRNSSVFLSSCTIWVEGITDRLYLKKYLELIQGRHKTSYKEDIHYSFIEYSGNNLDHWSFTDDNVWSKIKANKISNRILIIADQDDTVSKKTSKKARKFEERKKMLDENFLVLECREIENSLKESVIIKTVQDISKRKQKSAKPTPKKFNFSNYQMSKLGTFIDNHFEDLPKSFSDGGTIRDKLDFCKIAISHTNNLEDLSMEAIRVAEKILYFIKNCNS